ncbi:MAG: hypothetical protein ACRCV9_05320 [Burkholderiaceae bacterium]
MSLYVSTFYQMRKTSGSNLRDIGFGLATRQLFVGHPVNSTIENCQIGVLSYCRQHPT